MNVCGLFQVQVYSAATNQVKKTISRFREVAYSGCFRHDGKLLAAGSEEGVVKVGRYGGGVGREWPGVRKVNQLSCIQTSKV